MPKLLKTDIPTPDWAIPVTEVVMAKKYSRMQSLQIVKEARKSKNISGLLKNYGLAQRDLERMQGEYGSTVACLKTVVKSMFLGDGSRNPVIVPNEGGDSNLRTVSSTGMAFKSNAAQHKFYMKNIRKFPALHLPFAPWSVPLDDPADKTIY